MTYVIAHRGLRSERPENTLASIGAALQLSGIHGIEMDVETSHDCMALILHQETMVPDPTFQCVVPAERNYTTRDWVAEHSANEILSLDAGSWFSSLFGDQRVPSLSEVLLLRWHEAVAYIELKDATYWGSQDSKIPSRVVNAALPALRAFSGKLNVISFNPQILLEIGNTGLNVPRTLNLWTEWTARHREAVSTAKRCGATAVNVPEVMVLDSPEWVQTMHENGLEILTYPISPARGERDFLNWTAASQEEKWRKLHRLGVDGLMTDFARETLLFFEQLNS